MRYGICDQIQRMNGADAAVPTSGSRKDHMSILAPPDTSPHARRVGPTSPATIWILHDLSV
jgi:hypothetical protein